MSTSGELIFLCIFFFANFGRFCKIKYTQDFLLIGIHENKDMLNIHKIHV